MNRKRHAWLDLDRFRSWIPVVTLLFTLGHFANFVHFACVVHHFCAEHQQFEHVASRHESSAARPPSDQNERSLASATQLKRDGADPDGPAAPPCDHQHDACSQTTVVRAFTTFELPAALDSTPMAVARLAVVPVEDVRVPSLAVLRVAPKTSPPT